MTNKSSLARVPDPMLETLATVFRSNLDGVILLEQSHDRQTIRHVNQALTVLTGFRSTEVADRGLDLLFRVESDTGQIEKLQSALRSHSPTVFNCQCQERDGPGFWCRLNVSPIDPGHAVPGMSLLTLSKLSEGAEMRNSPGQEDESIEAQLSVPSSQTLSIMDGITDCFISLDRDWRFVYVNSSAARLADSSVEAMLNQTLWTSLPQFNPNPFLEAAASRESVVFMEFHPGIEKWFEVRVYPHENGLSALLQDVTQRKREGELIDHLIGHDGLTNLPNRTSFLSSLGARLTRLQNEFEPLHVLFVDLDRFKELNDAFGHAAGDRVLCELAMRFRDLVLDESQLARLGGDEFVFHLSGTKEIAESLARRIIEVASAPFDVDADEDCFLGASVGIASYPEGGRVAEDLLRNADTAMYEAKSEGRGVYRSFDPPMARKKINELQIRRDLRHATFRDELRLFYQPAFSLKSGLLSGAEALVRWQHPTRGLLGAASFVGLAEESQLMAMIGRWAVDEVCRQIGQWLTEGLAPPRISINLDARYFSDPSLPRLVGDLLARYGVAPHHLGLEITEGMLIPDPAGAAQVLKVLHSMGIRIALDDFGTGYSNLGYLQRFPIDTLKIDRSFVKNVCSNDENSSARLTRSILAMGAALGVRTLAEGVETAEQLEFLNRSGCDCAQGFLFSPAVPAGTFAHEFLKSPLLSDDPA